MTSLRAQGNRHAAKTQTPGAISTKHHGNSNYNKKSSTRENAEVMIANSSNAPKNCKQTVPYVWSFFASRFE